VVLAKSHLDDNGLKILNLLARNSRLSYRNIARDLGITTKSVKSRVDKMTSSKVIERFITLVNPSILGYKKICNFAIKKNMLGKETIDKISLVGDIHYQYYVMGGVEGFILMVNEGSDEKVELLLKSIQPAIVGATMHDYGYNKIADKLTLTDYNIIKELVRNPRMELSQIGNETSASAKTVRRRLDRMCDRFHWLEFTILPSPNAMKGQILFFLHVKVERSMYNKVLETILSRLYSHIVLSLMTYDIEKETIGLNLAAEDVSRIEAIRSDIQSLKGVKEANVFLPTKLQYHEEFIIRAIDRQIARIQAMKKVE
jgi:DNA-binding Lrp family transcriptional regulator